MSLPLQDIRVVDLSRVLAGPSAGQILGDLGADVIKIERPGTGDDTRGWGPPFLGNGSDSAYFLSANRNKRSVAVDISTVEGQDLVRRLIGQSDVVIENFKTGDLTAKGLGWNELRAQVPGLVYCSITGFGQSGPDACRPGYDFIIQGLSGLMSVTGEPEGQPMKLGIPISDILGGLYAATAILAGLKGRDRTGEGTYIDISLLDCQIASLYNQAANFLVGGHPPARHGNAHPNVVPYEVFETADGHINLAVGSDAQFRKLCILIDRPDLAQDPGFIRAAGRVAGRDRLIRELRRVFLSAGSAEWIEACTRAGVPCGLIRSVPSALDDPHVRHRGLVQPVAHPASPEGVRLIRSPIRMSCGDPQIRRRPPLLGEHTAEVLREILSIPPDRIADLHERGIVA